MPNQINALIVGGTSGIGREIAHALARHGEEVIVTGRDKTRARAAAAEIGGRHRGLALDLTKPDEIVGALATVGPVDHPRSGRARSKQRAHLRYRARHQVIDAEIRWLYRRCARSGIAIFSHRVNRGSWWYCARLALSWIDHDHDGEFLKGVQGNELYIFTHPHMRPWLEKRVDWFLSALCKLGPAPQEMKR
jgi:hypothetical protein